MGHGQHRFTYDHVFGGANGRPAWELYRACVAPLVSGLFQGYNATVFAYGQTGSGKTHTMGSAGFGQAAARGEAATGVIPRAMDDIFGHIAAHPDVQFGLRVGFVEIHNDEVRDLLAGGAAPPPGGIRIREVPGQGVTLAGANEVEVGSREEMAAVLDAGTTLRATAATGMNRRSSRSHAIFTITIEQRRDDDPGDGIAEDGNAGDGPSPRTGDPGLDPATPEPPPSYLCAKLHLVDLAGAATG